MKRLYRRIYFHFLAVVLIVGVIAPGIFAWGQRGAFFHELTERMARHLAGEMDQLAGDPRAMAEAAERTRGDLDMRLTVRGVDGRVISAGPLPLPPPSAEDLAELRAGRVVVRRHPWMAAAPIVDPQDGRLRGFLQFAPRRPYHPHTPLRPLLAIAVALFLVGLATAPLARRISRPVERLTEASRRFGAGDLSYRIPTREGPPGPDSFEQKTIERQGCDRARRNHHGRGRRWSGPPPGEGGGPTRDELEVLTQAWNDMAERVEGLLRGQKELLANVSHELRSPLARIRVALELLPRDADSERRIQEVEADIVELDRLIEDVLTSSRLEATGLPTHPEPVSARRLLEEVAERAAHDPLVTERAGAGAVRVVGEGDPEVRADAALVKRALFNLVENAAKYGAAPIELRAERKEDAVELSVSDAGPGIPALDRQRVLEPFFRRDSARTPGEPGARRGYGLGLTLARQVAVAHGGSIRIDPARSDAHGEQGCRVTLRLPSLLP